MAHLAAGVCCVRVRSMDKLYDLMLMGLKYQLVCSATLDTMLQVRTPCNILSSAQLHSHALVAALLQPCCSTDAKMTSVVVGCTQVTRTHLSQVRDMLAGLPEAAPVLDSISRVGSDQGSTSLLANCPRSGSRRCRLAGILGSACEPALFLPASVPKCVEPKPIFARTPASLRLLFSILASRIRRRGQSCRLPYRR